MGISYKGRTWESVPVPGISAKDLDRGSLNLFKKKAVDSQRLDKKSDFGGLVVECLASDQYKELAKKWNIDGKNPPINPPINETQKILLELLQKNNLYSYDELASLMKKHRDTVRENLKNLQELGLIRRVGARKNGHWEVLDK